MWIIRVWASRFDLTYKEFRWKSIDCVRKEYILFLFFRRDARLAPKQTRCQTTLNYFFLVIQHPVNRFSCRSANRNNSFFQIKFAMPCDISDNSPRRMYRHYPRKSRAIDVVTDHRHPREYYAIARLRVRFTRKSNCIKTRLKWTMTNQTVMFWCVLFVMEWYS